MLCQVRQERKKHIYVYMNSKKQNKWTNKTEAISESTKLMVDRWEGIWWPGDKGEGIRKYKLVVTG